MKIQNLLRKGQQVSISESAKRYSPKDFEYTIRTEDGNENPLADPDEVVEFSNEDKAKVAHAIITELPYLDTKHLKEVYDALTGGLQKNQKFDTNNLNKKDDSSNDDLPKPKKP